MVHWARNINGSSVMLIKPTRRQVEILRKQKEIKEAWSHQFLKLKYDKIWEEKERGFLSLVRSMALRKRKKDRLKGDYLQLWTECWSVPWEGGGILFWFLPG